MTTKATRDVIDLNTRPITNLKCTGGNIDGTPIGATTPSTGVFTNITATNITVTGNLDLTTATIIGTIHAYYAADLAEMYVADKSYPAGTVVAIGGAKEITIASSKGNVFSVIATEPAYVLNARGIEGELPVTLCGRVPVRVVGKVEKGQRLILSDIPGVAMAVVTADDAMVIGRSLVTSGAEEERLIEAVVKYGV